MANYVLIQDRHHQYMTRECPCSLHPHNNNNNNNNNMLVNFYHFLYTSHQYANLSDIESSTSSLLPRKHSLDGTQEPRRCTRCCINSVYDVGLLVDNKSGEEVVSNIGITRIFQIRNQLIHCQLFFECLSSLYL